MSKLRIVSNDLDVGPKLFTVDQLSVGDVVYLHGASTPRIYYMVFADSNNEGNRIKKGLVNLTGYGTARHVWAAERKLVKVQSAMLHIED